MDIGIVSYATGFVAFLLLTAWLIKSWQGQRQGAWLAFATAASTLWMGVTVYHLSFASPLLLHLLEILRNITWFIFLLSLLTQLSKAGWTDRDWRSAVF